MFVNLLCGLIGMAAISYFAGCDPVMSGEALRADSILALIANKLFKVVPGLTGLFIATLFSSTMSTVSTGINAVTTVFFKTILPNQYSTTLYMRVFGILFGISVMVPAMFISKIPGTLVGLSLFVLKFEFSSVICGILIYIS